LNSRGQRQVHAPPFESTVIAMAAAMLKSASALRLINVDWSNGRRFAARDAADRHEYRPDMDHVSQGVPPGPADPAMRCGRRRRPGAPAAPTCHA
jgi:hypothetical protein